MEGETTVQNLGHWLIEKAEMFFAEKNNGWDVIWANVEEPNRRKLEVVPYRSCKESEKKTSSAANYCRTNQEYSGATKSVAKNTTL